MRKSTFVACLFVIVCLLASSAYAETAEADAYVGVWRAESIDYLWQIVSAIDFDIFTLTLNADMTGSLENETSVGSLLWSLRSDDLIALYDDNTSTKYLPVHIQGDALLVDGDDYTLILKRVPAADSDVHPPVSLADSERYILGDWRMCYRQKASQYALWSFAEDHSFIYPFNDQGGEWFLDGDIVYATAGDVSMDFRFVHGVLYSTSGTSSAEFVRVDPYMETVSAGGGHYVRLRSDGTVATAGWDKYNQCATDDWSGIIDVSAGGSHTVALRENGTVVAVGLDMYSQTDVEDWTGIIDVSAGGMHTVGLKDDGTVVAVGNVNDQRTAVGAWKGIYRVFAGNFSTFGIRSDYSVVAVGSNMHGECDVEDWRDIIFVDSGYEHTVGLKMDGTVVATGRNQYGQCDVEDWRDVVAIAVGDYFTIGLMRDGTVCAAGDNSDGQCEVASWTDVISVSAGLRSAIGLTRSGEVLLAGDTQGVDAKTLEER